VFSLDVWTANDLEHIRLLIRNSFGWCFGTEAFFSEELRAGSVRMLAMLSCSRHVPSAQCGWPSAGQDRWAASC
jgi:hypothetical protein